MRPLGRSTRAHSASTGPRSTKLRSAKPHVTPVERAVGKRQPSRVGAHERRRGAGRGEHARREVDADRPVARVGERRGRGRRCRTRGRARAAPAGSRSVRDGGTPPADVHAERQHAVEEVVARRDAVEHRLDRVRLLGRRAATRSRRVDRCWVTTVSGLRRFEPARGLGGDRRELVLLADRLEVLLRDLEQHAAEVVRDERGDRGQQHAERGDELVGLLVVGAIGRRAAACARSCRTARPPARRCRGSTRGASRASASRSGSGKPGFEQRRPGAHDADVARGVARLPRRARGARAVLRARSPRAARAGTLERCASSASERNSSRVLGVGARRPRPRAARRSASSSPLDDPADQREREALRLELADAGEPLEVLGPVPGDAALAGGRRAAAGASGRSGSCRPTRRPARARSSTRHRSTARF